MNWDEYFMSMVYLVAMKSKDAKTQNGSVIVGPDNEVRSTGYNSFPRGINDDVPERQERPEKYFWFEHGERNAIYNAARVGVSLKGCRLYVTGVPCMDCARGIIQSGIIEVIADDAGVEHNEKWDEHIKRSLILFEEAGVKVRYYKGPVIEKLVVKRNEELMDRSKYGNEINENNYEKRLKEYEERLIKSRDIYINFSKK